jgi:hypothetical protein
VYRARADEFGADQEVYLASEVDARITELERALDSCLIVLGLELIERGKFQKAATEAIEEAKKVLAMQPSS